jgi:hypothetical protein
VRRLGDVNVLQRAKGAKVVAQVALSGVRRQPPHEHLASRSVSVAAASLLLLLLLLLLLVDAAASETKHRVSRGDISSGRGIPIPPVRGGLTCGGAAAAE